MTEISQAIKEQIIAQQIRLQDLLIKISTEYINADLSDIDGLVNQSLKQMGEFVEADRSYIFSYDLVNNVTHNTYEWCADGVEPEIQNLQNIPIDFISPWIEAHQKNEAFYVPDIELLPHDGEFGLRGILEPQGIKSLIAIPMINQKELLGFVGFDAVKKKYDFSENEKNILFVFANMLVNVRQRKENEERIKEQEVKKEALLISLEKQNKELNNYAHVVSHDLKAPLRNVNALINWVIEDNKTLFNETTLDSMNKILLNLEKMDNMIVGILDYSSIDKKEIINSWVDLNDIITESISSVLIPGNFQIKVTENFPKIYGNSFMFKQVFQNLISNAVKYNNKENAFIQVGFEEKSEEYLFFVKDNGKGIDKAYHEKIFNIFTKLENNTNSSGIGLSVVKKIVETYKGQIWVESELGQGTTFFIKLNKS